MAHFSLPFLGHFCITSDRQVTNALSEGPNSKVEAIKNAARGYRNPERFKIMIWFRLGGLDVYPVTHGKPGRAKKGDKVMATLRDAFLSRFNSNIRSEIIEYGKRLTEASKVKNAVMLFVARKAACLVDCLISTDLAFIQCPIISERSLEMNAAWLVNKNVIVVDDALISGTSLYGINTTLHKIGVASVNNIVLCVNKKWWSRQLITPTPPYIELDDNETASLCASIVEAISLIPRPYAVDYPLYSRIRIKSDDVDSIFSLPGWDIDDISSPLQQGHSVFSVTVTPREEVLLKLDNDLGWNFSDNNLLKIRFYGRRIENSSNEYWCNLLPVAAFEPVPSEIVELLFDACLEDAGLAFNRVKNNFIVDHFEGEDKNHAELKSKTRFVSFVVADKLANIWFNQVKDDIDLKHTLNFSTNSLSFLFPPNVVELAWKISQDNKPIFNSVKVYKHVESPNVTLDLSLDQSFDECVVEDKLMKPFLNLYRDKELKARELAKNHGKKVFTLKEYKDILNRLKIGYSLHEMHGWIAPFENFVNTKKLLSLFLDKFIDRGCVVPITCIRSGIVFRAYRHGEDVEFGEAEERLCVVMLDSLSKSCKDNQLSHIVVEKSLVLLIRIGLQQQFFNYWGGRLGDFQSMGVRFSLHGAISATGSEKLYHTPDSHGLTDIMESHGYIARTAKDAPWQIQNVPKGGYHPERGNKAILVGSLLGSLLRSDGTSNKPLITGEEITLLATGLYPKDIVGALAAQIDIATRDILHHKQLLSRHQFEKLDIGNVDDFLQYVKRSRFFFSANNGAWKFREFIGRTPWQIIDKVSRQISDPIYQATWLSFWPTGGDQSNVSVPEKVKLLIDREGLWLYRLKLYLEMLVLSSLSLNSTLSATKLKKIVSERLQLKGTIDDIDKYFGSRNSSAAAGAKLLARVDQEEINPELVYKYIESEIKKLAEEAKDILSEVDCLAATLGNPDKISYYQQVMHVNLKNRNLQGKEIWSKLDRVYHEMRKVARNQKEGRNAFLVDIPKNQTHVQYGRWICASGPNARRWLVALASRISKVFDDGTEVRIVIFTDSGNQFLIRRPQGSAEYVGPSFWARAEYLFQRSIKDTSRKYLYLIYDKFENYSATLPQEVNNEFLKQIKGSKASREISVVQPFSQTLIIDKYELEYNSTKAQRRVNVNLGILTVVPDEMAALNQFLQTYPNHSECQGTLSKRYFYQGALPSKSDDYHKVACLRALEQGNRSIMPAYSALIDEFAPKIITLIGIAGSIHKDADLCDVVIAEQIWYYDKRAVTEGGPNHRALSYSIEPWLRIEINRLYDKYGDVIEVEAVNGAPNKTFKIHLGPIGTGEAVIKHRNAEERKWLSSVNDKTLALETEAAGVAQQFTEDQLNYGEKAKGYLIIRGISDHADREKEDKWRKIAVLHAAKALELIMRQLPVDFQ